MLISKGEHIWCISHDGVCSDLAGATRIRDAERRGCRLARVMGCICHDPYRPVTIMG